jgi:hypothetical protein
MIYLMHCKNFCKCHNVPPPRIIKQKINKKGRTEGKEGGRERGGKQK